MKERKRRKKKKIEGARGRDIECEEKGDKGRQRE